MLLGWGSTRKEIIGRIFDDDPEVGGFYLNAGFRAGVPILLEKGEGRKGSSRRRPDMGPQP